MKNSWLWTLIFAVTLTTFVYLGISFMFAKAVELLVLHIDGQDISAQFWYLFWAIFVFVAFVRK